MKWVPSIGRINQSKIIRIGQDYLKSCNFVQIICIKNGWNYYYLLLESFLRQCKLIFFHRSLSDSKSSQFFRTLLSILADLNNIVVWMDLIRPLISKSSSPFNNPSVTVPQAPITIGIILTFMSHSFFNSLTRSRYLAFFSLSFNFTLCSAGTTKSTNSLFFC